MSTVNWETIGYMPPMTLDLEKANELISDAERRVIGTKARADADANIVDPPKTPIFVWGWKEALAQLRYVYYENARSKRVARRVRKAIEIAMLTEKNIA